MGGAKYKKWECSTVWKSCRKKAELKNYNNRQQKLDKGD